MSNVYIISDLHFNHLNMANHRGFQDCFTHDENIIAQWNSAVHKKDIVYILGDITMETCYYSILDRLDGIKYIVGGNHDKIQHSKYLMPYVAGIAGMVNYKRKFGRFVLTHCPIHPMELDIYEAKGYNVFNIHGHVHNGYKIPDRRYINVCAEVINYTPKKIEELI